LSLFNSSPLSPEMATLYTPGFFTFVLYPLEICRICIFSFCILSHMYFVFCHIHALLTVKLHELNADLVGNFRSILNNSIIYFEKCNKLVNSKYLNIHCRIKKSPLINKIIK